MCKEKVERERKNKSRKKSPPLDPAKGLIVAIYMSVDGSDVLISRGWGIPVDTLERHLEQSLDRVGG